MSTKGSTFVLVGGPRDGRSMAGPEDAPPVLVFPFSADARPVRFDSDDPMPEPLPKPEHYKHDGIDEDGRHRYVFVAEWSL